MLNSIHTERRIEGQAEVAAWCNRHQTTAETGIFGYWDIWILGYLLGYCAPLQFTPLQQCSCLWTCADRTHSCFAEMQWIPWPASQALSGFLQELSSKVEMGLGEANAELLHFYPACWKHHTLSLAQIHTIFCQPSVFNLVVGRRFVRFMLDVDTGEKKQP